MKPGDLEFVRGMDMISKSLNARPTAAETQRLLTLLYKSEAMRKKGEWELEHNNCWYSINTKGIICTGSGIDIRHYWTDSDWIAAVRKEIEG